MASNLECYFQFVGKYFEESAQVCVCWVQLLFKMMIILGVFSIPLPLPPLPQDKLITSTKKEFAGN